MSEKITDLVADLRESGAQTYETLSEATIDVLFRAADALEASVQAPAVDRAELILSLANDECWEKDGAGGWEFVPELGADRLIASGVLQDAADIEVDVLLATSQGLREHYPESVFPRPDDEQYAVLATALARANLTLDRFSADLMRRAADQVAHAAAAIREGRA